MRRRDLIKVITGIATAAWPRAVGAQRPDGKVWRVGLLSGISGAFGHAAFVQGMRELGHEEHTDYVVELRDAGGHYERFPELARELVQLKVDVLLTGVTAAIRSLKEATTTILCVPKTLSVLIGGGNHLTSAHNDRAAMLCPKRLGLAI
jgi:putative tryptophan/tyrosine transport system substrate-binding protein